MADDEVRFHLLQLVNHQPRRVNVRGSFTFFEPLVFTCWDSIGHIIAEKWAEQHPQVFDQGQHVVTAVSIDDHWLPIWLVLRVWSYKCTLSMMSARVENDLR